MFLDILRVRNKILQSNFSKFTVIKEKIYTKKIMHNSKKLFIHRVKQNIFGITKEHSHMFVNKHLHPSFGVKCILQRRLLCNC